MRRATLGLLALSLVASTAGFYGATQPREHKPTWPLFRLPLTQMACVHIVVDGGTLADFDFEQPVYITVRGPATIHHVVLHEPCTFKPPAEDGR